MKQHAVRLRAAVLATVMVLASVAATVAKPTKPIADVIGMPNLETMIPAQFGEWRVDTSLPVILPSPDLQAQLDKIYNQTLSRTYTNGRGQRVMLSLAYGGDQSDATSAHRPEACYPAQGFAIKSNRPDKLNVAGRTLDVRELLAVAGERHEPITYWIIVGDEVVTTGVGQKLAQMRYGLKGYVADGFLVRVSTIDRDTSRAFAVQRQFLQDMAAALAPAAVRRLMGPGAG